MKHIYSKYPFLKLDQEQLLCFHKCSKETLDSILTASYLCNGTSLGVMDLTLGLFFNSILLQKILNLNNNDIIKLKLWYAYDFKLKLYKFNPIIFSTKVLFLLKNVEWMFKEPNTLNLFYCIYYLYYEDIIKPIFKQLNKNIRDTFIYANENFIKFRINVYIPELFSSVLKPVIFNYTSLVGRTKECIKSSAIFERNYQRNPIIIGEYGIGKSKCIEKIAFNLTKKAFLFFECTKAINLFRKNPVVLYQLINYIKKDSRIILIIKDIDILFDSSHTAELLSFIYYVIDLLQLNKIQLIGTTTSESKYKKIIESFYKLNFLFTPIKLKEMSEDNTIEILEKNIYINKYENNKNMDYKKTDLKYIFNLSKSFIKKIPSPTKELLVLDYIYSKYKSCHIFKLKKSDIVEAITTYSNIPSSFIDTTSDSSNLIKTLNTNLRKKVFGQETSIEKIVSAIQRTFTGLKDKNKPIGSWLLCGPSGTGKTELVKSLATTLFGSESDLIRFDMSEFKEAHDSVKLIGCPPGYIGYDKGGILTSAVKEKPYSVILFDEIEKAHPNVNDLMLQLLDEGSLTDSYGERFDFSNTIIIFTSNLGCPKNIDDFNSESIKQGIQMNKTEYNRYSKNINKAIKNYFRPELLNRLTDILVFNPLTKKTLIPIAHKYISILQEKLTNNEVPLYLDIDETYLKLIINNVFNPLYGARPLKRKIEEVIENPISEILSSGSFINSCKLSILVHKKETNINELVYMYTPFKKTSELISNYTKLDMYTIEPYIFIKRRNIQREIEKRKKQLIKNMSVITIKQNNVYYTKVYLWYLTIEILDKEYLYLKNIFKSTQK